MFERIGYVGTRTVGLRTSGVRLAMVFLLVGTLGCTAGSTSGSSEEVECWWDEDGAEPLAGAPVQDSQVFLDLSRTMRGFISEGRGRRPVTLQQELLRTILLEALGTVEATPSALRGFGREVFPLEGTLSSYAAREGRGTAGPRELYDQAETDVVGALLGASEQPSTLSVILTDNAQDLRTAKERRAPGFDRSAMIRALTYELSEKGFGVWLVGFQNDFRGTYFSILLAADKEGVRVNKPIPLRSAQPLYTWVISQDLEKGRAVVDHLVRELRRRWRARNIEGQPPIHAVELAPGVPPEVSAKEPFPEELEVDPEGESSFDAVNPQRDVLRVRDWGVIQGDPPRAAATLGYQRPRGLELLFLLKVQLNRKWQGSEWGSWPQSAWHLKWRAQLDGQGPKVDLVEDLSPFQIEQGVGTRFRKLAVPIDQIRAYEPDHRRIQIPLSIAFERESIPTDHWLRAWSTDDDTTREGIEGKTLYLFDVTASVLERTIGRKRPAACFHLTLVEE